MTTIALNGPYALHPRAGLARGSSVERDLVAAWAARVAVALVGALVVLALLFGAGDQASFGTGGTTPPSPAAAPSPAPAP